MPKQEKEEGDAWDPEERKANRTGTQEPPKEKRRRGQDSEILAQAMLAQARIAHSLRARVLLYCVGITSLRTQLVELAVQVARLEHDQKDVLSFDPSCQRSVSEGSAGEDQ